MMRRAFTAVALFAGALQAQSLASRVDRAPDGVVRLQVASRPGVCGDGKDLVGFGNALFANNFETYGRWHTENCVPGPLRITVSKMDGQVTRVRTQVGGAWPYTELRVTDLGAVDPEEASPYFLSLVPKIERGGKDRSLIPVVLAYVDPPLKELLALARDEERYIETRRSAIHWLGQLGDESVVTPLTQLARADADEYRYGKPGKKSLSGSAMAALSMLVSEAGQKWLLAHALDPKEPVWLRKDALFWAGQSDGTPTADLVRVYREATDRELQEHAIFVLSQRDDRAATDSLMRIAREDRDTKMRGKALFWLAQKDDPRVQKLIADIVLKP